MRTHEPRRTESPVLCATVHARCLLWWLAGPHPPRLGTPPDGGIEEQGGHQRAARLCVAFSVLRHDKAHDTQCFQAF